MGALRKVSGVFELGVVRGGEEEIEKLKLTTMPVQPSSATFAIFSWSLWRCELGRVVLEASVFWGG